MNPNLIYNLKILNLFDFQNFFDLRCKNDEFELNYDPNLILNNKIVAKFQKYKKNLIYDTKRCDFPP